MGVQLPNTRPFDLARTRTLAYEIASQSTLCDALSFLIFLLAILHH